MTEPDYEHIMADREERRGEAYLDRMDARYGRVEDYRPTPAVQHALDAAEMARVQPAVDMARASKAAGHEGPIVRDGNLFDSPADGLDTRRATETPS